MKSVTEKYTCSNCELWIEDPSVKVVGGATIKLADGVSIERQFGRCRRDPPVMAMVPQAHPLDAKQIVMNEKPIRPVTASVDFCSCHPAYRLDTETLHEMNREHARRTYLEYKPGKHDDATAAGFSRVPSLDEAKRMSRGAGAIAQDPTKPHKFVATVNPAVCDICGGAAGDTNSLHDLGASA